MKKMTSLRIHKPLLSKLEAFGEEYGMTVSEVIRFACLDFTLNYMREVGSTSSVGQQHLHRPSSPELETAWAEQFCPRCGETNLDCLCGGL
jgi:hypothetical protein